MLQPEQIRIVEEPADHLHADRHLFTLPHGTASAGWPVWFVGLVSYAIGTGIQLRRKFASTAAAGSAGISS